MTNQEYVKKFAQAAIDACSGTNQLPSVILAQALLEGGGGGSLLASKYHNHFGLKCPKSWNLKRIALKTGEETRAGKKFVVTADFCVFDTDVASFKYRVDLIENKPVYAKVKLTKTPLEQVTAIKAAGYATDTQYVSKLMAIINSSNYNLTQYDKKKAL